MGHQVVACARAKKVLGEDGGPNWEDVSLDPPASVWGKVAAAAGMLAG